MMGISRSASVVAAYIIATRGITASEAIEFLRKKRPIVCPNIGFRRQLENYSEPFILSKQLSRKRSGIMERMKKLVPGSTTPVS
jgi:atypical dual specificity phosphatase